MKRLAILSIGVGLTATACSAPSSSTAQGPASSQVDAAAVSVRNSRLPDVVVVSVAPSQVALGAQVRWSAVVQNIGLGPTPAGVPVGILFTVDSETVHTWGWTTTQLAAGAKTTISAMGGNVATTWTATQVGSHTLHAFVDDVNRFAESNESNNKLDATFTVGTATTPTTTPPTTAAPSTTYNSTTPTAVTTRDLRVWPFASTAPWNMPVGDGATFDSRPTVPGPLVLNSTAYGVCVGGAGYALNTNCSGEGHYSIYRSDGVTADEYYGYNPSTGGSVNHMVTDVRGNGVGVGWDVATQMSQLGGLIRNWDLQQGVIRHALQLIAAPTVLSNQVVWPALSGDGYISSTPNTGFVPYGGLLAIPPNATMPAGMSSVGQMIWTALRNYGAYVVDSNGVPGSATQNYSSLRGESSAAGALSAAGGDMAKIGAQLRWVTNSSQNQLGGPGNRLAPLAP